MNRPPIRLGYTVGGAAQEGAGLDSALFELLGAVYEHGSIVGAAKALDRSYRHTWGEFRRWEEALGRPLLDWNRGQPARLTPYALRLMWAERQLRARMAPHLEALRTQLQQLFVLADDPGLQMTGATAPAPPDGPHARARRR
jgi:putative molybdopterin biosynthesis protein